LSALPLVDLEYELEDEAVVPVFSATRFEKKEWYILSLGWRKVIFPHEVVKEMVLGIPFILTKRIREGFWVYSKLVDANVFLFKYNLPKLKVEMSEEYVVEKAWRKGGGEVVYPRRLFGKSEEKTYNYYLVYPSANVKNIQRIEEVYRVLTLKRGSKVVKFAILP